MKRLLLAVLTAGALTSTAVYAKPTAIQFAKGSYCGSWEGRLTGTSKEFSLLLNDGQSVEVITENPISVKGPKGFLYRDSVRYDTESFETNAKGAYIITVYKKKEFADVEFIDLKVCAY